MLVHIPVLSVSLSDLQQFLHNKATIFFIELYTRASAPYKYVPLDMMKSFKLNPASIAFILSHYNHRLVKRHRGGEGEGRKNKIPITFVYFVSKAERGLLHVDHSEAMKTIPDLVIA